jgi:SanA protein
MKKFWKFSIIALSSAAAALLAAAAIIWYSHHAVGSCTRFCYKDIEHVPFRETALLPGAAKIVPSGKPNLYFSARVVTAAKLFHAGKIKHILISGDNSRKNYDEPTDMKNALLALAVPETAMTLDYAGFRTLDSVVRAKTVFKKNRFTVITQPGHAERAVYIARKHDIDAIAFYADEPIRYKWLVERNRKREKLAWAAAWLDVNILFRKPKFEQ